MTTRQFFNMIKQLARLAVLWAMTGASMKAHAQAASQPASPLETTQNLVLPAGRSSLIQTPWPVTRVTVTDSKIADVQVLTPRQVLVLGKALGSTDMLMWGNDTQVWKASIDVQIDRTALKAELVRLFPRAKLELGQVGDTITISGQISQAEEADQLHRYFEAASLKYVDLTRLPGLSQVQLKVTIAEASRGAVRALGFNAIIAGKSAFGGVTIGADNGGPINPVGIAPSGSVGNTAFPVAGSVSPATTLFGGIPSADLEIFVQALAENQYLRVLAEPTLVALSGQEASFLAGGEFPVPVPQTSGTGTAITVEYKEFGVRLRFRPTVEGDGVIRLHVAPEVSDISNGPGSVQISGFNIPALLTRRAETTLQLHSGQTFAMAGLMNQSVQARNSRVPGLGDVPVLGPLFRSVRYQNGDSELLVLVTASTVSPLSIAKRPTLPGTTHTAPNDWQLFTHGAIDGNMASTGPKERGGSDKPSPAKDSSLSQLKGPGAWASYGPPTDAQPEQQK